MAAALTFHNDGTAFRLPHKRAIREWVCAAIAAEGFEAGDVAYIFCSREKHLEINRQYLGHDYPTDVITFDYSEGGVVGGDIFIDPETVAGNAARFGSTKEDEMRRVLIHGVLHLCGQHDKTPEQQKAMRAKENLYLSLWNE